MQSEVHKRIVIGLMNLVNNDTKIAFKAMNLDELNTKIRIGEKNLI